MSLWNPSLCLRPSKHVKSREGYIHIREFPARDLTAAQAGALSAVGTCYLAGTTR